MGAKNLSRSETLVHFSAKRISVRTELRFPATSLVAKLFKKATCGCYHEVGKILEPDAVFAIHCQCTS